MNFLYKDSTIKYEDEISYAESEDGFPVLIRRLIKPDGQDYSL